MQSAALAFERLADEEAFARATLNGLSGRPKSIPCRFLYDARGSALFEMITELPEYYPTRTEIALLHEHAPEIAGRVGSGASLVEFGSGSSRKTRIVLDALDDVRAYVPIDIAEDALFDAAAQLGDDYPFLRILPLHADFAAASGLPLSDLPLPDTGARLGFFPGSTIGNFSHAAAEAFLRQTRRVLGPCGSLLVGVDLRKDERMLRPAYDDAAGVTAAFNLNILERINRELEGTFRIDKFSHEADWNPVCGRIEMRLVSNENQFARVLGRTFDFPRGERIYTEHSHKYTVDEFRTLAASAGWRYDTVWTDDDALFSLHYLETD